MKKYSKSLKVAIVYDRVNKWGGAERVLLALHDIFPNAPLYTSVYDPKSAPWSKVFPKVIPSFLNKVLFFRTRHELLCPLMPIVFESFDFSDFDLVISVTSEAAKGIITKPMTKHICYCLTPTRYLWSGYKEYFDNSFKRSITKPIINYLRKWDLVASRRPDVMIAISSEVQLRIKEYYKRESEIIYPPIDLHPKDSHFPKQSAVIHPFLPDANQDYFLLVGRLVKYKKVDLAIRAFNDLGLTLVIIGAGREEKRLKKMAKRNIHFIKNLTDRELIAYYKNCKALIAPQREDFGLTMAEAQSFGKPVLAFRGGGALDIVKEGKSGLFFDKQNKESIIETICKFNQISFNKKYIKRHAEKFSRERFMEKFKKLVDYDWR